MFSVDGGRRVRPGFGRRRRRAAPPRGHAAAATTTLQPSAFRVSEHEHLKYSLSLSRQELDNLFQRKNYLFNCTKIAYLATQYMLQILNGPKNAKKPLQYSFSIEKNLWPFLQTWHTDSVLQTSDQASQSLLTANHGKICNHLALSFLVGC